MKDVMRIFNEYAKTYDLKDKAIMNKFHHSYRVMEYSIEIAKSLKLNDEDIRVTAIAGLFHDIARFKQWTKYKTFIDSKSFDHGDIGYKILKEELIDKIDLDEEEKNVVLNAVRFHNKYRIDDNLSHIEETITNIVRDADKLDIMTEQGFITKEYEIKDSLVNNLLEHRLINNNLVETDMDELFRIIAFIFDLNYKYSYDYLLKKQIIENKINLLEIYGNKDLKFLEEDLIKYMKERL
ncbi:MAG: HD domain-containing protein [Bacilli bacterium]|nr:HD domain-containing protein [Bacilli bacterium]